MVARDGNTIKPRHVFRGVSKNVGNQPHAGGRWIDVGIADHELLQDVVLDGSAEVAQGHSLLFRGDNVKGQNRDDRAIHGHRNGHAIQGNALKEALHILDAVDGYARFSDVAHHPRMVAVIAAVGREIKGHAEAHLACS